VKPVLDWIKANVVIVILGVVALGALVAGWIFSGSMNAEVRKAAEERARKESELASLERTSVTLNIPGREPITKSVVLNQPLLDQYVQITEKLTKDADEVHKLALARNRGNHRLLMDGVFPQPPATKRETIPNALHKELVAAYERLLASVGAGMPPLPEELAENLMRREAQFIQSNLRKAGREQLDPGELETLKVELAKNRLAMYGEHAQKVGVYADMSILDIPPSPENRALPSVGTMFDWQWKYWITSDILGAIADASSAANEGRPGTVLRSPVKRVLSIRIADGGFGGRQQPQGASFGGAGAGFGDPGAAPPAAAAPVAEAPLAPPQIDLTQEAKRDFSVSFTGRTSNAVYDVRRATVSLIVETARMPELFDAIARRNFMTVLDVKVKPADAFSAARDGFIYGKQPVSEVTLLIESVWLREWTAPFMPADVRTALGITQPGAAGEGGEPPAG
jgi:hypothetical protein